MAKRVEVEGVLLNAQPIGSRSIQLTFGSPRRPGPNRTVNFNMEVMPRDPLFVSIGQQDINGFVLGRLIKVTVEQEDEPNEE